MIEIKAFRFTNAENGLICFLSTLDLREGFAFLDEKIKKFLKKKLAKRLRHPNSYFGVRGVEGEKAAKFNYISPRSFEDNEVRYAGDLGYVQWTYEVKLINPLSRCCLAYSNLQTISGLDDPERLPLLTRFDVDNGENQLIRRKFSRDGDLNIVVTRDFAEFLELPIKSK